MLFFATRLPLFFSSSLAGAHVVLLFTTSYAAWAGTSFLVEVPCFSFSGLPVAFYIFWDLTSCLFLLGVFLISACVMSFSFSYMGHEKFSVRFHWLVLSFIFSMGLLIVSPNLLSLLLGWDGLGLSSYLLVVYFQSTKSFNAGLLTALTNRVGDVLLLLAIASALSSGVLLFGAHTLGSSFPASLCWLIVLAACTKSAQLPFSAWLPAAMAAPTPVSALVHSSTLVTAGVFLTLRFYPALYSSGVTGLLLVLGSLTMFMAGSAALREMDGKKIVALSTLSQLGVMMTTLGVGLPSLAFFHLLSHAFFKALLFISVGSMIHLSSSYQDIRKTSLFGRNEPVSLSVALLANISLCGLPFMSGFYSKDLCIESFLVGAESLASSALFWAATALTCAYSVRFTFLAGWSWARSTPLLWSNDYDTPTWGAFMGLVPWAVAGGAYLGWVLPKTPVVLSLSGSEKFFVGSALLVGFISGKVLANTPASLSRVHSPLLFFSLWSLPLTSTPDFSSGSNSLATTLRALVDVKWGDKSGHTLVVPLSRVSSLPNSSLFWVSSFGVLGLTSTLFLVL